MERRGSVKLGVIAEERSMVATSRPSSQANHLHLEVTIGSTVPSLGEGGGGPRQGEGGGGPRQGGIRVAVDRVAREKSAAREPPLPPQLAHQLLTLSRTNVSQVSHLHLT